MGAGRLDRGDQHRKHPETFPHATLQQGHIFIVVYHLATIDGNMLAGILCQQLVLHCQERLCLSANPLALQLIEIRFHGSCQYGFHRLCGLFRKLFDLPDQRAFS